jgi:serine/threonine-protein kinase
MKEMRRSGRERTIGRFVLADEIGSGGMGTVHLGYLDGLAGFSRTVAIKRLHTHLTNDPDFTAMFLDEARVAARIAHPNVVATLDVVQEDGELLVVMEYVDGQSLARLSRAQSAVGPLGIPIAVAIAIDVLHGLHAAHEARSPSGASLGVVHRDVSPHNVVVGRDGMARVLDFGVAKASSRLSSTGDGRIKGKLAYMAPEQLGRGAVDRRVDIFAASIVLWETITGERLFARDSEAETAARVLSGPIVAPSAVTPDVPRPLDEIVLRGLSRSREGRYETAREMATALEATHLAARRIDVAEWVERVAGDALSARTARARDLERSPSSRSAAARESNSATDLLPNAAPRSASTGGAPTASPATSIARPLAVIAVLLVAGGALLLRTTRGRSAPSEAVVDTRSAEPVEHSSAARTVPPAPGSVAPGGPGPALVPRARAHPPAARPASSVTRATPHCDPPYYFEADGAKHLKAECLR